MPNVDQKTLEMMFDGIADENLKGILKGIVKGEYPYSVFCMSKKCKGRLIGHIDERGRCIDAQAIDKKTGKLLSGIESSRDRFDGRKGFRCYCGNNSIQCAEEKGIMGANTPTKDDLEKIYMNLQKSNKQKLQFINGVAEYDGFKIVEAS